MKNLELFSSMCGQIAMPNVVIVTTMWAYVPMEMGRKREEVLKGEVWNNMLGHGCSVERFEDTFESAWRIVESPVKDRARTYIQREIVVDQLRLNETEVGLSLNKELTKLIRDQRDAARKLAEQAKAYDNELVVERLNKRTAEIEERIRQTADQLRIMKIPFTRRVRLYLKGKRGSVSTPITHTSHF
jgi:hypothetical protein